MFYIANLPFGQVWKTLRQFIICQTTYNAPNSTYSEWSIDRCIQLLITSTVNCFKSFLTSREVNFFSWRFLQSIILIRFEIIISFHSSSFYCLKSMNESRIIIELDNFLLSFVYWIYFCATVTMWLLWKNLHGNCHQELSFSFEWSPNILLIHCSFFPVNPEPFGSAMNLRYRAIRVQTSCSPSTPYDIIPTSLCSFVSITGPEMRFFFNKFHWLYWPGIDSCTNPWSISGSSR